MKSSHSAFQVNKYKNKTKPCRFRIQKLNIEFQGLEFSHNFFLEERLKFVKGVKMEQMC